MNWFTIHLMTAYAAICGELTQNSVQTHLYYATINIL